MYFLTKATNTWLFLLIITFSSIQSSLAKEIIKVGASNFPPNIIINEKTITGIEIILANKIAKKLNLEVEYVLCPWKRCLKLMQHGQVDLLTGVYKRPERDVYMLYISPQYFQATGAFYVSSHHSVKIKHYDDLKNISIGLGRGIRVFEPFDSDTSLNKHVVNDLAQAMEMTRLGRLDTFAGSTIYIDYLILKNQYQSQIKRSEFIASGPDSFNYFAISKSSKYHLKIDEFNQAMKSLQEQGEIESVFKLFREGGNIPQYPLN